MEVEEDRIIQEALAEAVGHSRFHLGHANRAIRLLSQGNHWRSAEALLAKLRQEWNLQINEVSLNAAISGLWWPRALWLLQKLRHHFAPKDAIGSNAAAARFPWPTAWRWSRRLLCQLQLDGLQPTKISFNTAITAAAKHMAMETSEVSTVKTWRQAMDLWQSMGEAEETISRNGVLSSLGGRWRLASQLLASTPMARLRASIITYNSTVHVYEKAALWRVGCQLIGKILDHQMQLDLFSSNGSLKTAHHWRRTLHCLAWMRCRQLEPDQVSLSAAITKTWWNQSLNLLHPESPLPRPNEVSLSAAISACEKSAQWSSALVLMAQLPTMTLKANTTSCNALLSACEKGFNWTQAIEVLHQMDELRVASSGMTWNAMASASEKCAQWQLALQTLPSAPGFSEPMAFNAAMVACTKGEASSWGRVLYLLASLPSATSISYDSALASLVARWPMALETMRQMQNDCGCTAWSYEMLLNAMTVTGPSVVGVAQQLLAEVSEEVTLELLEDLRENEKESRKIIKKPPPFPTRNTWSFECSIYIFPFPIHSSCWNPEDSFFDGCQRLKGVARSLDLAKLMHQSQALPGLNDVSLDQRAPTWINIGLTIDNFNSKYYTYGCFQK